MNNTNITEKEKQQVKEIHISYAKGISWLYNKIQQDSRYNTSKLESSNLR